MHDRAVVGEPRRVRIPRTRRPGPATGSASKASDLAKATPRAVTPTRVSNVETTVDKISFDVDEIGKPVEVKTSYFPNWKVSGAKGPYRLAPNLMVVVPTSKHVELTYGLTAADWLGRGITVAGVVGLVLLGLWTGARRFAAEGYDESDGEETTTDDETPPERPTAGIRPTRSRRTGGNRHRRYHDPALTPEPLLESW